MVKIALAADQATVHSGKLPLLVPHATYPRRGIVAERKRYTVGFRAGFFLGTHEVAPPQQFSVGYPTRAFITPKSVA